MPQINISADFFKDLGPKGVAFLTLNILIVVMNRIRIILIHADMRTSGVFWTHLWNRSWTFSNHTGISWVFLRHYQERARSVDCILVNVAACCFLNLLVLFCCDRDWITRTHKYHGFAAAIQRTVSCWLHWMHGHHRVWSKLFTDADRLYFRSTILSFFFRFGGFQLREKNVSIRIV
jgi:hypothetical protein